MTEEHTMKNSEQFAKDLNAFAEKHGCEIAADNYGQILIYTGRMLDAEGNPIPFRDPERARDGFNKD
jgi:hypothetical protein